MTIKNNAFNNQAAPKLQACEHFTSKLANETDCSDVYSDYKNNTQNYILLDVRSEQAFDKSHAINAINIPHKHINT